MKKLFSYLFVLFFVGITQSQEAPVKINTIVKKIGGNQYELIIRADLDPDWGLYSQNLPKGGPMPTKISFKKSSGFVLLGKPREVSSFKKVVDDDIFNVRLTKFYNNVVFKQLIEVKNRNVKNIQADINYMVCSSTSCLPPKTNTVRFRL